MSIGACPARGLPSQRVTEEMLPCVLLFRRGPRLILLSLLFAMSWASFFPRAQAEEWRAAMDDQKAAHEGELGAERESHAKTTAAFNAEESARVKAEQDLAIGMA